MQRLLQRVEDLERPCAAPRRSVGAPTGTTMNSWKSTLLSAWAPPFSTFIIGTGSTCGRLAAEVAPQRHARPRPRPPWPRRARRRGSRWRRGAPCSACRRARSSRGRGPPGRRRRARAPPAAISPFTFATACVTPLPPHASPPSRSSTASNSPVEAPEGTAARPGGAGAAASPRPRRSGCRGCRAIWRAWTCSISLTGSSS